MPHAAEPSVAAYPSPDVNMAGAFLYASKKVSGREGGVAHSSLLVLEDLSVLRKVRGHRAFHPDTPGRLHPYPKKA